MPHSKDYVKGYYASLDLPKSMSRENQATAELMEKGFSESKD